MNIILFDSINRMHLLPLTYTRPVAALKAGISTIAEKWERNFPGAVSMLAPDYLKAKFAVCIGQNNVLIDGSILPDSQLIDTINKLQPNEVLADNKDNIVAIRLNKEDTEKVAGFDDYCRLSISGLKWIIYEHPVRSITRPWHLFSMCGELINDDFRVMTANRTSAPVSESNRVVNAGNIFIEDGAVCEFSILNASNGPIYIGKDAEIMENCVVRGPFVLGEHSTLKIGAKIYGATVVGDHCKVGGEVNNSVFLGYSNKAHDGFLGNAVIGEWCNLGADTNNSNLKNTYEEVKLWSHVENRFVKTGLQFCGLIMGDHSKCGINTMFNTGTVAGVSCNLYGDGFHRNYIPSFSWGSPAHMTSFQFDKAMVIASKVMERRSIELTDIEIDILRYIYDITFEQRR